MIRPVLSQQPSQYMTNYPQFEPQSGVNYSNRPISQPPTSGLPSQPYGGQVQQNQYGPDPRYQQQGPPLQDYPGSRPPTQNGLMSESVTNGGAPIHNGFGTSSHSQPPNIVGGQDHLKSNANIGKPTPVHPQQNAMPNGLHQNQLTSQLGNMSIGDGPNQPPISSQQYSQLQQGGQFPQQRLPGPPPPASQPGQMQYQGQLPGKPGDLGPHGPQGRGPILPQGPPQHPNQQMMSQGQQGYPPLQQVNGTSAFQPGGMPPPTQLQGQQVSGPPPGPHGQYTGMQQRYPPTPATGMAPPPGHQMHQDQMAGGYPSQQQYQQQQSQRRLDPDQMPSPIQVIEEDKRNRSGTFATHVRGQVPPLVTTDFVCVDQGNSSPRFIRSTMYSVPATIDMMKQTSVPLALTIAPFAQIGPGENPIPIVNLGELGPVRCVRCKAYMCPFMQFVDGGRRFQCSFCKVTTEVPAEYFAHLDHTGQRVDKFERPELCLGSYEFIATKDYCKDNQYPNCPAIIFAIDVSYNSIRSGMLNLLCDNIMDLLDDLPTDPSMPNKRIRVGFITFGSNVHFYNLKNTLAQPQMMVVTDVADMFMPLLDGFLVDPVESRQMIECLVKQLPEEFAENKDTETLLGPAIQAGLEALVAATCAGKLLLFNTTLPIAEAPGRLKNRDDRKLLGTDKEKSILGPQTAFYSELGAKCVNAGCSVDLFAFPNAYMDIATIGQVCRMTGGSVYRYSYFQADVDGNRFLEDLRRNISRQCAFDAIMRVRTSTGVRPVDFYGNFNMTNTTDVEIAAMDTDKAVTIEIKHDDKITDEEAVFVQVAVLYTSVSGQRRLRMHNLSLNVCLQMADQFRNCELDTIMNFFAKSCLRQLFESNPKQVKENFMQRCAQILACYRKNCASPSSPGQLILPECMKLMPLYANCLIKSDAISGGSDMATDDRAFVMQCLSSMDVGASVAYFYPRLIPVHEFEDSSPDGGNVSTNGLPVALRCTMEKIRDDGAYILENGLHMFLYVGLQIPPHWLQNVFGVPSINHVDVDKTVVLDLDTPASQHLRGILEKIREERQRYLKLTIVRQKDKLDLVFRHFLVEDKGMDNSTSYVDFLCQMHKEIRTLLN